MQTFKASDSADSERALHGEVRSFAERHGLQLQRGTLAKAGQTFNASPEILGKMKP